MVKVTESGMTRSSLASSTIMQNLTFTTFMVSEKIAALKFLCHVSRPASQMAQNWSLQRPTFYMSKIFFSSKNHHLFHFLLSKTILIWKCRVIISPITDTTILWLILYRSCDWYYIHKYQRNLCQKWEGISSPVDAESAVESSWNQNLEISLILMRPEMLTVDHTGDISMYYLLPMLPDLQAVKTQLS